MRKEMIGATLLLLSLASAAPAQDQSATALDQPLKVKGGHTLGESAEQFFGEGYERDAFVACDAQDFKALSLPNKRKLKDYCQDLTDDRSAATSGKRYEYKGSGDTSELRVDTFTFDGGHLVKQELVFTAPAPEANYRGQSFDKIFNGLKQNYGPPTGETSDQVQDTYGVRYVAHHELWLSPQGAILINQKAGPHGSTTLTAVTRAEYDRMQVEASKAADPLQ